MSFPQRRKRNYYNQLGRGGGARSQLVRSKMYRRSNRQFVPRTMGPFSISESKYFDSARTVNVIPVLTTSWAGTEQDPATQNCLFAPQEGSDINNRVGRKVSVYKLSVRGFIYSAPEISQTSLNNAPPPAVRVILYMDQQTNGTQSQGEELMNSHSTDLLNFQSHQNPNNFGRFRVLRDITYKQQPAFVGVDDSTTDSMAVGYNGIPFKMVVRFKKPVIVKFNSTNGGDIGDIVDNSFHIIAAKSQNTNPITYISYNARTYYKDQ